MTEPRHRGQSWHAVVLLCCAAVFIWYIDRTDISVAAIPMKEQCNAEIDKDPLSLPTNFSGFQ